MTDSPRGRWTWMRSMTRTTTSMPDVPESPLPPLGGKAPPLQCNRLLRWPDETSYCGKEAKWHIIWTEDCENGVACDEHAEEARQRWAFYAIHEYEMECSMPGAVYVRDFNICVVDEEGLGLHTVEAVSVGASHNAQPRTAQ